MTETPNTPPSQSLKRARTLKWAVVVCLALALLVWIVSRIHNPQQSSYRDRRPLPSVENTESHPQPSWLLDRG